MKKIFFLINKQPDFSLSNLTDKYLNNFVVEIGDSFPKYPLNYDLIVLWNYKKILKGISKFDNIIIFHSSNLPEGKGWSPIFYSINNSNSHFVISGILPGEKVDSGDIVCQAKFKIQNNHTAKSIRKFDQQICMMLINEIYKKLEFKKLTGKKQIGESTFNTRRIPEDNKVEMDSVLSEIFNFLRSCESSHPAYVIFNGIKYNISITPEPLPSFPSDLEITFFE